jgi:hypothetical protein
MEERDLANAEGLLPVQPEPIQPEPVLLDAAA